MSIEKQIEERLDLSDTIDYAMRDWDDYIDECQEEGIPPIDTFEEYIADYVLRAGYRKQEWISVDERLPDFEGKYLVYTIKGNVTIAYCYSPSWESNPQFDYWVTHWMPLPEPPKGE